MMRCCRRRRLLLRLQDVFVSYVSVCSLRIFVSMFTLVIRTTNNQMQNKNTHCMHISFFFPTKFEICMIHSSHDARPESKIYMFNILSWFSLVLHCSPYECQIKLNSLIFFSSSNGCYSLFNLFFMQRALVKIIWLSDVFSQEF